MKSFIEKIATFYNRVAQNRTAKELLTMTDSRLTDIGLSRYKLEQGAAGYPWKLEVNAVVIDFTQAKKPVSVKVTPATQSQEQVAA